MSSSMAEPSPRLPLPGPWLVILYGNPILKLLTPKASFPSFSFSFSFCFPWFSFNVYGVHNIPRIKTQKSWGGLNSASILELIIWSMAFQTVSGWESANVICSAGCSQPTANVLVPLKVGGLLAGRESLVNHGAPQDGLGHRGKDRCTAWGPRVPGERGSAFCSWGLGLQTGLWDWIPPRELDWRESPREREDEQGDWLGWRRHGCGCRGCWQSPSPVPFAPSPPSRLTVGSGGRAMIIACITVSSHQSQKQMCIWGCLEEMGWAAQAASYDQRVGSCPWSRGLQLEQQVPGQFLHLLNGSTDRPNFTGWLWKVNDSCVYSR